MLTSTTIILKEITDDLTKAKFDSTLLSKADFAVRYACFQTWYLPCSTITKMDILTEMLHSLQHTNSLLLILKTLHGCVSTKSTNYSRCHNDTNYLYDKHVRDDNRTLDQATLDRTRELEMKWFETLEDSQQVLILIGLIRLGGGAVIQEIYKNAKALYREKIKTGPIGFASAGSSPDLLQHEEPFVPARHFSVIPDKPPQVDPQNPYVLQVEKARKEWNDMMNKYRAEVEGRPTKAETKGKRAKGGQKGSKKSSKPSKKPKGKKKKGKEAGKQLEELDRVQLLPIWIVKKIFNYLDAKTLKKAKQVNKYWAYAVSDLQKDIKARKILNKAIFKMKNSSEAVQLEVADALFKSLEPKKRIQQLLQRGCTNPKLREFKNLGPEGTDSVVIHAVAQNPSSYVLPVTQLEYFPRPVSKAASLYKVPSCVRNELGFMKADEVFCELPSRSGNEKNNEERNWDKMQNINFSCTSLRQADCKDN